MKADTHFWKYLSVILRIKIVSDKIVEEIKTRILYSIPFFRKSYRLWDNVEKYCTAWQATDDMAHAQYLLNT